jgi:fatty acid desaturase
MATTMLPDGALLPKVLPTDRLNVRGMAVGQLRTDLRKIASWRNALTVVSALAQTVGLIIGTHVIVERTGWWPLYGAVFVLMGRGHACLSILGHESAHKLLFANQRMNDVVGAVFCNALGFTSQAAYRRSHFTHHRDPLGPNEPDLTLYRDYPVTAFTLRRRLRRDATGESGWKLVKGIGRALRNPVSRGTVAQVLAVQAVLAVVLTVTVGWWAWPVLWFAPWMTVWRVINRLRAIAEHGGMTHSDDDRLTTHHVHQSWSARFWMVPYNTGWHLAHHADMGVPWRNLPRLHHELVNAGHLVPELEYPNYRALWRRLGSRPVTS